MLRITLACTLSMQWTKWSLDASNFNLLWCVHMCCRLKPFLFQGVSCAAVSPCGIVCVHQFAKPTHWFKRSYVVQRFAQQILGEVLNHTGMSLMNVPDAYTRWAEYFGTVAVCKPRCMLNGLSTHTVFYASVQKIFWPHNGNAGDLSRRNRQMSIFGVALLFVQNGASLVVVYSGGQGLRGTVSKFYLLIFYVFVVFRYFCVVDVKREVWGTCWSQTGNAGDLLWKETKNKCWYSESLCSLC